MNMQDLYAEARAALDGLVQAKKDLGLERVNKAQAASDERTLSRLAIIPRDMCCPNCKVKIIEIQKWVIKGRTAICRSCSQTPAPSGEEFGPFLVMRNSGAASSSTSLLVGALRSLSITQRTLSKLLNVSESHVSRTIHQQTPVSLAEARSWCRELNLPHSSFTEHKEWLLDGVALKQMRLLTGLSTTRFGRRCGWKSARQLGLESLKSSLVRDTTARALLQTFADYTAEQED